MHLCVYICMYKDIFFIAPDLPFLIGCFLTSLDNSVDVIFHSEMV